MSNIVIKKQNEVSIHRCEDTGFICIEEEDNEGHWRFWDEQTNPSVCFDAEHIDAIVKRLLELKEEIKNA